MADPRAVAPAEMAAEVVAAVRDLLFEGQAVNLVGLPGTGRTVLLGLVQAGLQREGWEVLCWTGADLGGRSARELRQDVVAWCGEPAFRALLIDDYGTVLGTEVGERLEMLTDSVAFSDAVDPHEMTRVVIVTTPRDEEIPGPSPGIRERAHIIAVPPVLSQGALSARQSAWGWDAAINHVARIGMYGPLVSAVPRGLDQEWGVARRLAREAAPILVGSLSARHQRRLGEIWHRYPEKPSGWREGQDEVLRPLVTRDIDSPRALAVPTPVFRGAGLASLLICEPWPDRDFRGSARRVRARCGKDLSPLWVDPYLARLDDGGMACLTRFLGAFFTGAPVGLSLRILTERDPAAVALTVAELAQRFDAFFGGRSWQTHVQVRLGSRDVRGHARYLCVHRHHFMSALPPCDRVIGRRDIGDDAESILVGAGPLSEAEAHWRTGTMVI